MDLQQQYQAVMASMEAILACAKAEDRDFTDDEQSQYDAHVTKAGSVLKNIEREASLQNLKAKSNIVQESVANLQPVYGRTFAEPAQREFDAMADFLAAVAFNPNDQRLAGLYENINYGADGNMNEGRLGGFMIPKQLSKEIYKVDAQDNVIRSRARVIPAGSPPDAEFTMPKLNQGAGSNLLGGVSVNWIAEGKTIPQSPDLKFEEESWKPNEVSATYKATNKMLRNWQAASGLIDSQLREAVLAAEDVAFLRGNGVGKPLGILNLPATRRVSRAVAAKVSHADLINMITNVRMARSNRYVWLISNALQAELYHMRNPTANGGNGELIYVPSAQNGLPPQLLGFDVVWYERASMLGSLGDISLVDLSEYYIKDGSGPFVSSDGGISGNNFETNLTSFKITWNVDGRSPLAAPYSLENGSIVSPFITLDIPA